MSENKNIPTLWATTHLFKGLKILLITNDKAGLKCINTD